MKNRRVGTKFMLAVAIVAVFSIADGLYALASLGATNEQVKAVYGHSLQLDAIGDLRSAVNQTWLAADDYVIADDDATRAAAPERVDRCRQRGRCRGDPLQGLSAEC